MEMDKMTCVTFFREGVVYGALSLSCCRNFSPEREAQVGQNRVPPAGNRRAFVQPRASDKQCRSFNNICKSIELC